jgi:hypothetical protein
MAGTASSFSSSALASAHCKSAQQQQESVRTDQARCWASDETRRHRNRHHWIDHHTTGLAQKWPGLAETEQAQSGRQSKRGRAMRTSSFFSSASSTPSCSHLRVCRRSVTSVGRPRKKDRASNPMRTRTGGSGNRGAESRTPRARTRTTTILEEKLN